VELQGDLEVKLFEVAAVGGVKDSGSTAAVIKDMQTTMT